MVEAISAGVLCYSYAEPTQDIYFLLGRQRQTADWPRGSNRWSDFGGCVEDSEGESESEVHCAAREFVEESMALVPISADDSAINPYTTIETVQDALKNRKYTYRIAIEVETDHVSKKHRVCYVRRIPWLPELPDRFEYVKTCLDAIHDALQKGIEEAIDCYNNQPPAIQQHPAIDIKRDHDQKIIHLHLRREYREIYQIKWWSLHRIKSVLKTGGSYKNKYCFRSGFLTTIGIVLQQFYVMENICHNLGVCIEDFDKEVIDEDDEINEVEAFSSRFRETRGALHSV